MKHYIITGASRGFGRCLAGQLATPGHVLHLVARSEMEDVQQEAVACGAEVRCYRKDLSQTGGLEEGCLEIFDRVTGDPEASFVALINNAGMLSPIGPMGRYDPDIYHRHLQVNYVAVAMITHHFLARFQDRDMEKRIVMISSGAAQRPYYGWSHYCSTKAGVDMLMQCITLEQQEMPRPVRCMAFSPGRIETGMQQEIRRTSEQDFRMVEDFRRASEDGRVRDPGQAAAHLAGLINADRFPDGEVVSFKGQTGGR